MAQPDKIEIDINLESSDARKGVKAIKADIEALSPSGKKAAASVKGSFTQMTSAVTKFRKVLSTISFGSLLIDSLTNLIRKFGELRNAGDEAAKKARELNKEIADKAAAERIKELAESYRNLTASIADANKERQRQNELFNEKLNAQRDLEDAEMDADEADELAAIDPNAPDAEKQRTAIRDRYSAKRTRRAAERRKHDLVNRRMMLNGQAEAQSKAADELEATLEADDKAILRARTKASTLEALSHERNEKDRRWYNPGGRTEEGDEERKRLAEEAEKAKAEAEKLEKQKAEKEKQIAELRSQSAHSSNMADALWSSIEAADLRHGAAITKANTAEEITAAERQQEEARRASAMASSEELSRQQAALQARIAEEQSKKNAANLSVWQAQNALDLTRANGGSTVAATQTLQNAQAEAANVNFAADQAINALTATLKAVEERLKAATSYLKNAESRNQNAWEDGNAGGLQ